MKKLLLFLTLFITCFLPAQTIIPLTDNLSISSDQHIQFEANEYFFSDTEADGVVQLIDVENVILEGPGVLIDGDGFEGYFLYLENCHNITIKNFDLAKRFFYAVYAENCTNITIDSCNFSSNQRDDEGWIVIFDGPEFAHGGGVFLNNCSNSSLTGNLMTDQNDGIAIYNCDNIDISGNDLSWNTGFGIRMFQSHYCTIYGNNCSYVNRLTDPSDCAAILLLDAFNNEVTQNDFTHSGDGIFLNNYFSMEPANNYFAYNDCSFSPHNAIEAVFSDGNTFKHNTCNYSNYGFWLGYSFNSVIDSNEIQYNGGLDGDGGGGIAIDRGYQNTISNNLIGHNSHGIKLWEGDPIDPYTNESEFYSIFDNTFTGNRQAASFSNTNDLECQDNIFNYNYNDIFISEEVDNLLIQGCYFGQNAGFYIENQSGYDIQATNNNFHDNPMLIDCKIYDHNDFDALGTVFYEPYTSLPALIEDYQDYEDLTEPPHIWDSYFFIEDAALTTILWDEDEKVSGDASLFIETESGWDVHTHYFPTLNHLPIWNIDETRDIEFSIKINITDPNNLWGVQESFVRIGDACGNYYQYNNDYFQDTNPAVLNEALDTWTAFTIPIAGNDTWIRTQEGDPDLTRINYIEFNIDVWEYGYQAWIDGVSLPILAVGNQEVEKEGIQNMQLFPNPTEGKITVRLELESDNPVNWALYSLTGQKLKEGNWKILRKGLHTFIIDLNDMPTGTYFLELNTGDQHKSIKINKM